MSNKTEVSQNTGSTSLTPDTQRRSAVADSILRPPVDIYETGEGITLQADMPGVSKEQLNLRVEGNSLLVDVKAPSVAHATAAKME
jgi:HSP20 family protein